MSAKLVQLSEWSQDQLVVLRDAMRASLNRNFMSKKQLGINGLLEAGLRDPENRIPVLKLIVGNIPLRLWNIPEFTSTKQLSSSMASELIAYFMTHDQEKKWQLTIRGQRLLSELEAAVEDKPLYEEEVPW